MASVGEYSAPYLDSSVWIDFLAGPSSSYSTPERASLAADIFDAALGGRFKITASVVVMVEVLRDAERADERTENLESFFQRACFVWLDLTQAVARRARQLAREHRLKPMDAVHVATALHARCDTLLTADRADLAPGDYSGQLVEAPHFPFDRTLHFPD